MRIGLISDTHVPVPGGRELPKEDIERAFAGADLILHAGDIYVLSVLDWLETIAPVLAVVGHRSEYDLLEDPRLRRVQLLTVEGLRIGMVHELPLPILTAFPMNYYLLGQEVDIVICGDTHVPMIEEHGGILVINPGSPTLPGVHHRMDRPGTVAVLEVNGGKAEARIVQL